MSGVYKRNISLRLFLLIVRKFYNCACVLNPNFDHEWSYSRDIQAIFIFPKKLCPTTSYSISCFILSEGTGKFVS